MQLKTEDKSWCYVSPVYGVVGSERILAEKQAHQSVSNQSTSSVDCVAVRCQITDNVQ